MWLLLMPSGVVSSVHNLNVGEEARKHFLEKGYWEAYDGDRYTVIVKPPIGR